MKTAMKIYDESELTGKAVEVAREGMDVTANMLIQAAKMKPVFDAVLRDPGVRECLGFRCSDCCHRRVTAPCVRKPVVDAIREYERWKAKMEGEPA